MFSKMFRTSYLVSGFLALMPLLALAAGPSSDIGQRIDPVVAPPPVGTEGDEPPTIDCRRLGPGWKNLGEGNLCVRQSSSALSYMEYDFATQDPVIHGSRIDGHPILTFENADVTDDTRYPELGTWFFHSIDIGGETFLGPSLFHLSLAAQLEFSADGDGNLTLHSNSWDDEKLQFYPGLLSQAWARFGGLQLGIQPSKFDFLHGGYSKSGSYAPKLSTAAISYTGRPSRDFSWSIALEDPERRLRQDGVLNSYEELKTPDVVAQTRMSRGNLIMHLGVARHEIEDRFTDSSDVGHAAMAAFEYKFKRSTPTDGSERSNLGLGGRLYGGLTIADGAIGYLGAPYFATDYVVDTNGDIDRSTGISAVLSYENVWTQKLRSTLTLSYFATEMEGMAEFDPIPTYVQSNIWAKGVRLAGGAEMLLDKRSRVGAEVSYNWTSIEGEYGSNLDSYDAEEVHSAYPELLVYFRRTF